MENIAKIRNSLLSEILGQFIVLEFSLNHSFSSGAFSWHLLEKILLKIKTYLLNQIKMKIF